MGEEERVGVADRALTDEPYHEAVVDLLERVREPGNRGQALEEDGVPGQVRADQPVVVGGGVVRPERQLEGRMREAHLQGVLALTEQRGVEDVTSVRVRSTTWA